MKTHRGAEISLFTEAIQLPPAERSAFLGRACAGDEKLLRKVEGLLKAHVRAGDFLEKPPPGAPAVLRPEPTIGEKAGDQIGRYRLLEQIGEGGWGVVFMAEQEEPVRRRVAVKIVKPGMDTKSVVARFEAEQQALALMDHSSIAHVFDAGATDSGRPYFVMELVPGVKVTDYCDENSLKTSARLELFVQICDAVQHAHQKGIIHRDIKPSNILVSTGGDGRPLPKIIDFGIAKATTNERLTDKTVSTGFEMLMGTPAYMSPEQAALTSVEVDTQTDIYSLGVLLYELLTGTTPFDARELLKAGLDEVRRVIRNEEPVRPSTRLSSLDAKTLTAISRYRQVEPPKLIREVRGDLDWIVMKALEKDPRRRYATANGLAMDVKRCLAAEPVTARPPSKAYQFQKMVFRNKALFAGIAGIAFLLITSLVFVSMSLAREHQARRESDSDRQKAQEVTKFLEEMLRGVGPSVAMGRDTTMLREILNHTVERVGVELKDQPAVEAELRDVMGQLYFELGDYAQAEGMERTAVEIYQELGDPESAEEASSLNELGLALLAEGKLPEAEDANSRALAIRRRRFGNENADVAISLNNLGSVYRQRGKLTQAKAATLEGLEIQRKLFGNENLAVADSLRNLSLIQGDEGNWADAETTAREVLAIRQKLLGPEHPWIASALADVAWAAGGQGKLAEAESLERDALAMRQKLLSSDHPDVAKSLYLVGDRLRQRGNLNDAYSILSASLSVQQKVLGEDSPAALDTMRSLALTLEAEHKLPEAEQMEREALTLWHKRDEAETPAALGTLDSLGATLETEGKWTESEQAYREALAARQKHGEPETPQAIWEAEKLSRMLVAQKRFGDAESLLDIALTPAVMKEPSSANLLFARGRLRARRSLWVGAADDVTLAVRYDASAASRFSFLGALLAKTHNVPAYEQFCAEILKSYSDTTNIFIADQVAKACLFLPSQRVDLKAVGHLADMAVSMGTGDEGAMPYFCICKALSEYRQGHYAEAADWARKPLGTPFTDSYGHAYAILSMAEWRLGQTSGAREAFARAEALAPAALPADIANDPGDGYLAWLFARVTLEEASELMQM